MWREIGLAPLGVIKERFALLAEESREFEVQISHGQTQTHTHAPILTIIEYQPAAAQVC